MQNKELDSLQAGSSSFSASNGC
eukprot:COSAG01_NODE_6601_length_3585_cov_61.162651_1_plen_22_part_10